MALNDFDLDLKQIIVETEEKERFEEQKRLKQRKSMIERLKINSNKMIELKTIESLKRLFHFSIDRELNYKTSKPIPKLVKPKDKTHLRVDLELGFEECLAQNSLITDYCDYRNTKWIYFLKCLRENQFISDSDEEKPSFVSFGGPIADIMSTVYDSGIQWKVLAQKFRGVIYLQKCRTESSMSGNHSLYGEVNKRSFCGLKFVHLISDRNEEQINEFEKHFVINELKLDSHKLLTLNEIDAIDDKGLAIDAKVVEVVNSSKSIQLFNRKKLMRFWSKACVQGIHKLIIGNTNSNNFLVDIEEREVTGIPDSCKGYWNDSKMIAFLNRFFDFAKKCITEEMTVYELTFNRGEEYIDCYRINDINDTNETNDTKNYEDYHILPQFYTNKCESNN